MSLHTNYRILEVPDWPLKTFVKETKGNFIEKKKEEKNLLAFVGSEATLAYQSILSEEIANEDNALKKDDKTEKSNLIALNNSKSAPCVFSTSQSQPESTNINSIMREVEQGNFDFVKWNLNSLNVNISDDFGWTPLMSASYCGHLDIVNYLILIGANKKIKDKSGLTAARLALKKNHLNVVALLRKKSFADTCEKEVVEVVIDDDVDKEETTDVDEFYCPVCKVSFKETTLKSHESSTLHIFNKKPKLPNMIYGCISKQNKGYQMLINTGWDEENGLGPSGKGLKYPVKTILKNDRKGIGHPGKCEPRITHFKPGDIGAVKSTKNLREKTLKKKDREKLLSREMRKERAYRLMLS